MAKTWKVTVATGLILAVTVSLAASQDLENGRQAFREGDYGTVFRVLEPLAQEGIAEAQFLIGEMFLNGYSIPKVPAEAASLFRRAAKQGHAKAQFALSRLLSAGLGVERNAKLAAQWNLKAAMQGHGQAQLQMGYRCDLGDGVATDRQEAARWYVRAAENGAVDASVGLVYCAGSDIKEDFVAGYLWLSVYLESSPTDDRIREILSFCADEMSPGEIERAKARYAEWREEHAVK
jgi:TPR repeat protein